MLTKGVSAVPTLLYHVYAVGRWREITAQVLGFSDIFDKALISVAGDPSGEAGAAAAGLARGPAELRGIDASLREPGSWNRHFLPEVLSRPGDTYFYCHSKGVTRQGNPFVGQWRDKMVYFLLERYADYVAPRLPDHGFVGIERKPGRPGAGCHCTWYYAGNFWWMNPARLDASRLRPLDTVAKKRRGRRHGQPRGGGRVRVFYNGQALEAFPGTFPPEAGLCLYGTDFDLYKAGQPRSEYESAELCGPGCMHPMRQP